MGDDTNDTSNDGDSDVELDGVDLEDVEDEEEYEPDDDEKKRPATKTDNEVIDEDDDQKDREAMEDAELEAANRERQELLKSAAGAESIAENDSVPVDAKMSFLMKQSDVFAQFLAGNVASDNKKKKKSQPGGRGRMSEQEEDARLMKTAQSKVRVVRLDHQPRILASECRMHPYQLEGLNWLISKYRDYRVILSSREMHIVLELHDHGINGILADEMGLVSSKCPKQFGQTKR